MSVTGDAGGNQMATAISTSDFVFCFVAGGHIVDHIGATIWALALGNPEVRMHPFLQALVGGLLLGAAALTLLGTLGRTAGISGIVSGLWRPTSPRGWQVAFVVGLVVAGVAGFALTPTRFDAGDSAGPLVTVAAGLLVGFGSRLGSGCTSGHGICGLSRLSPRSAAAVVTFMGAAGVTVYVVRHLLGGAP